MLAYTSGEQSTGEGRDQAMWMCPLENLQGKITLCALTPIVPLRTEEESSNTSGSWKPFTCQCRKEARDLKCGAWLSFHCQCHLQTVSPPLSSNITVPLRPMVSLSHAQAHLISDLHWPSDHTLPHWRSQHLTHRLAFLSRSYILPVTFSLAP